MKDLNRKTYDIIIDKLREANYEGHVGESSIRWMDAQLGHRVKDKKKKKQTNHDICRDACNEEINKGIRPVLACLATHHCCDSIEF